MNNPEKAGFKFHSLSALRFFAFGLVFLKHINGAIPCQYQVQWIKFLIDGAAVEFFFVLGGFLFTFLLIKEKEKGEGFSFKKFYLFRILRTWPLFFVVVGGAYAFVYGAMYYLGEKEGLALVDKVGFRQASGGYWPSWKHTFLFLENYKMWQHNLYLNQYDSWFPQFSPLVVTWFLCIQEHFYLLWPLVIIGLPTRMLPKIFLLLILSSMALKYGIYLYFYERSNNLIQLSHDIFTYLDLYSVGGLLGYYTYFYYNKIVEINAKTPRYFKLVLGIALFFFLKLDRWFIEFSPYTQIIWNTLVGIFLALFLFFFIPAHGSLRISAKSTFTRLGQMSYSLYLIHIMVIHCVLQFFQRNELQLVSLFNCLVFACICFVITILISFVTYTLIEKPSYIIKDKIKKNNFIF